ncbi:uncharacterized protein M421DRAFT_4272 [Didymella exigua CBS 183.55]|uniref:Uncharacterized protein n=1 Tax=Didymella exigua CBS 183.55 TaxID=1150837 RepID=A0A6A5RPY0_9PLEO|nr:uncharacterized protein M421DRAFT_4272 [Didymella exigua CBS 183.55]KAF1929842.1 hypothetical protein M421DRAFT_4272 [Didymella exigua CBS 183.55]
MLPSIKAKLIEEVVKERNKYITKDAPSGTKGDELVQAAAATVGFFSEISHHRKEKPVKGKVADCETAAATKSPGLPQTSEEGTCGTPAALTPKGHSEAFLYRHPPPISSISQPDRPLASPVLIPQRRPNKRARGFTPAYAPILDDFDVPKNAFLDFIITLNASLEPSPYLNAINLASFAGEASPEPLVGFLIGEAVETVTDAIMEAHSRMKSNYFLEMVNEGFFAPRGLFAFVGLWRPDANKNESAEALCVEEDFLASHPQVSVTTASDNTAKSDAITAKGGWRKYQHQLQRAMLPSGGDFSTIVPAPLLWPSSEEIAAAIPGNKTKKKGRFDRAGLWMDEHVDKHSQITWTQENPKHPLAGSLPKSEFRSRYADPSHAASSGDVIALFTGGQWHTKEDEKKKAKEARKQLEKERKKEKKLEYKREKARLKQQKSRAEASAASDNDSKGKNNDDETEVDQRKRRASNDPRNSNEECRVKGNIKSGFSSLLEDNLLYLVIVQHPSLASSK